MTVTPRLLAMWRADAEATIEANADGAQVWAAGRIVALLDALDQRHGEGWASYAAEQERHTETTARLELMTREARLSREATENAVRSRVARHEIERAFRAADAPEDSMATEDDLLRYEGRAEAVAIMRDMLGLVGNVCRAPGYNGQHVAVGAGAVGSGPYVCHGCGGVFDA